MRDGAETSLLSALLWQTGYSTADVDRLIVSSGLVASDFSAEAGAVFTAIAGMVRKGEMPELHATEAALLRNGIKVPRGDLKKLFDTKVAWKAVPELVKAVKSISVRRQARPHIAAALKRIEDMSVSEVETIESIMATLAGVRTATWVPQAPEDTIGEVVDELISPNAKSYNSWIKPIDTALKGCVPGVITLVGAHPGVGKSALLGTWATEMASRGTKVGFLSLEDGKEWLVTRLLSLGSGIPLERLRTNKVFPEEREKILDAQAGVYEKIKNLFLYDEQNCTPEVIVSIARMMAVKHGCEVIFVDHIGEPNYRADTDRRDLEISKMMRLLRAVAKEHKIPIVVAAHLRRRNGSADYEEPILTDFADSSGTERICRAAIGMWKEGDVVRGKVLKNTNGPSGTKMTFAFHKDAGLVNPLGGSCE